MLEEKPALCLEGSLRRVVVQATLRRCPKCAEVRRFIGRKCRTCGLFVSLEHFDECPALDATRCRRCQRLVAASIDELCGLCAVLVEFRARIKAHPKLSRDDRSELAYTDPRLKAMADSVAARKAKHARSVDPQDPDF